MDKIILVGFQGSGKNTVGEYLVEKYGYVGISFADALKDAVASIFCWDRNALEGNTPESREWRETIDTWWANKLDIPEFTPRWAMRNFGTDLMRTYFDKDIWIHNVERRIRDFGDRKVVVFDGRFPNEIDLITEMFGGTSIRVKRGDEPEWWDIALAANTGSTTEIGTWEMSERDFAINKLKLMDIHPSEYSWIGHPISITLENNGSISELRLQTDRIMKSNGCHPKEPPFDVWDLLGRAE